MIAEVLALLAVSTLPAEAAERKPIMEITRKADLKTVDGPAEYFTGRVTITGQFQREAPSRVGGAIVHDAIMRIFDFDECLVSEADILDGLVWSLLER